MERFLRFATITLIALMVWLYAEGATRKQQRVSFKVQFVAPKGQRLRLEPGLQLVNVTVRCASSQMEQINRLKSEGLAIEVTDDPTSIERKVNLTQMVSGHDRFVKLGVTVEAVEPESINLRAERWEERELRLELVTPTELELAGPATFSTDAGKTDAGAVVVPASFAGQLEGLKLQARLDANALAGIVPGVPQDRPVDVALPATMAAIPVDSFWPRKVNVTFTVKKKEEEFVVGLIPVRILIGPNQIKQYDVDLEADSRSLRDLKIKGPNDAIGRIRRGETKLEAFLKLEPEDLEKMLESKLPELNLPAGVTVDSTLPLIKVKITRREGAP